MSQPDDKQRLPAWPLGCVIAVLGLMLSVNLVGLIGILVASAGLPFWFEVGAPVLMALLVPALMLGGGLYVRRRNPYAARALLWGFGLTLAIGATLTLIFNLIDRAVLGL